MVRLDNKTNQRLLYCQKSMNRNDNSGLRQPLSQQTDQRSDTDPIVYQRPPPTYPTMQDQIIVANNQDRKSLQNGESALGHLNNGLEGSARRNFIKKVYSIVGIQLLFTVLMCILSTYVQGFMRFQVENYSLMYVSLGLMIATQIMIFCCKAGRKHPYNIIALGIFTLAQAYIVSFIAALVADAKGGAVVVMAACMTLALVAVLTLYAIFTKTDFTTPWAIMLAFVTSIIMFFMFWMINWTSFSQTLYCSIGIFVFGLYLIIDTQMIIGNKQFSLSIDDYVVAALLLYIDIIQLFLYILNLLGGKN